MTIAKFPPNVMVHLSQLIGGMTVPEFSMPKDSWAHQLRPGLAAVPRATTPTDVRHGSLPANSVYLNNINTA